MMHQIEKQRATKRPCKKYLRKLKAILLGTLWRPPSKRSLPAWFPERSVGLLEWPFCSCIVTLPSSAAPVVSLDAPLRTASAPAVSPAVSKISKEIGRQPTIDGNELCLAPMEVPKWIPKQMKPLPRSIEISVNIQPILTPLSIGQLEVMSNALVVDVWFESSFGGWKTTHKKDDTKIYLIWVVLYVCILRRNLRKINLRGKKSV